jgi:hypothetical protein
VALEHRRPRHLAAPAPVAPAPVGAARVGADLPLPQGGQP